MIRNPKLFPVSPFAGYKYDKSELVRKQDFVSKKDIEVLLEKLKKINRMDAYMCIQLLSKYGLRIGVFQKMVVNEKNGQWKSISKGSKLKGKFTIEETKRLLKSGLLNKKPSTLSILIKRQTGLLFEKGKISCPFSPHDLRHYCITKKLNECGGNFEKMFGVSRQFHKNFSTTMGYYNYRE
jgi:integrase